MRYSVLVAVIILSLAAVAAAETIRVIVNEGICRPCRKNVETILRAQPKVETVHFDSDNNMLTIQTKPRQTLSAAKLEKLIGNAGYTVLRVVRQK